MEKELLKTILFKHYAKSTVDAILRGSRKPTYEKMTELKDEHNIPYEVWKDIDSFMGISQKKRQMKGTSLRTCKELKDSEKLHNSQLIIIELLLDGGKALTRKEISNTATKQGNFIPINSVCGRVKELIDSGVLEELERRKCSITGNTAYEVFLTQQNQKAA